MEWKYLEHKEILELIKHHKLMIASEVITDGFSSIEHNLWEFYRDIACRIMEKNTGKKHE